MMTKLKYVAIFLLYFSGDLFSQTKEQINVLNDFVSYILKEEKVDTLLLVLPYRQFIKGELNYRNYSRLEKLPIDSISMAQLTNSMPAKRKDIWPKIWPHLILTNTQIITWREIDTLRKTNVYRQFHNRTIPDTSRQGSISELGQFGIRSWYNLSNPIFTKDHNYAIVRLLFDNFLPNLSEYMYFILKHENGRWVVIKGFGRGHICY